MTTPLLHITGMTSGYGVATHVRIPNLTIQPGQAVALLGPNGAGKSATLRAIMGLNPAASQRFDFAGAPMAALPPEARARHGIAYVPQGRRLFPGMTVTDNLLVAARVPAKVRAERMRAAFDVFPHLTQHRHQLAWRLSGGQQQMLAIARALMAAPRLVLLDEPTLGLAPPVIAELNTALAAIAASGAALLITEQNHHRLPAFCTTTLTIHDGEVSAPD